VVILPKRVYRVKRIFQKHFPCHGATGHIAVRAFVPDDCAQGGVRESYRERNVYGILLERRREC